MSWQDNLREASFKGIPFHFQAGDRSVERRVAQHEYAYQSGSDNEDLGGKALEDSITGFLIGPDFIEQRERLEQAFNSDQPGILIHPYFGAKLMRHLRSKFTVKSEEGGYCTFEALFVAESPAPNQATTDLAQLSIQKSDGLLDSISGTLSLVVDGPADLISSLVKEATKPIAAIESAISSSALKDRGVERLAINLARLRKSVTNIVKEPQRLAAFYRQSFDLLAAAVDTSTLFNKQQTLKKYAATLTPIPGTSNTSKIARKNQAEVARIFELTALCNELAIIPQVKFPSVESYEELVSQNLDYLTIAIDESAGDNAKIEFISRLRREFLDIMSPMAIKVSADIKPYTSPRTSNILSAYYMANGSLTLVPDKISSPWLDPFQTVSLRARP